MMLHELIESTRPFQWTNTRMDLYVPEDTSSPIHKEYNKKQRKKRDKIRDETWFIPEEKNILFWQAYILKHRSDKYNFFGNKQQIENEEKFHWIEALQKEKKTIRAPLRKHGIKVDDIMNDIASNRVFSLESFVTLCVLFQIPLTVTRGRFVFFIANDSDPVEPIMYTWLRCSDNAIFHETKERNAFMNDYIEGHTLQKPLLSASAYKMDELKQMATLLGLPLEYDGCKKKKKKKQELYDSILEFVR
jgi:hypothetical protein